MSLIDTSANLNRWRRRSLTEKALLSLGMLLIAVSMHSWHASLAVVLLMTAATLLGARVKPMTWWHALTAPLGFLVVAAATLAIQVQGWHVSVAPHGVELAARLGARALAGLTCLLFLALTTPATDLVAGMRRLHIPAEIAEMALLMYRFLFLLTETAEAMHSAQSARLGHINYRRHMHSLSLLIANLVPRAFARAHALETGLAARGWRGELRVLSPIRPVSLPAVTAIVALECAVLVIGLHSS
jgi:cobalt/nickel transport system permease protein